MKEYELIRSQRKTIAIYIREGRLIVRAPKRASVKEIHQFVLSKQDWIKKHLTAQLARAEQRAAFSLTYGSAILYLGRAYSIVAEKTPAAQDATSQSESVTYSCSADKGGSGAPGLKATEPVIYFPPALDEARLRKKLVLFYKEQARTVLSERVCVFAPLMGVRPTDIQIGSAKRSWGSCNAAGRICFSWRLMMADPDAVDYVVIHELAHLKQLNHSAAFWAIVTQIMPDWKERRQKLRLLQKRLAGEDWG